MLPGFPVETKKSKVIFVIGTLNTKAAVTHFKHRSHKKNIYCTFLSAFHPQRTHMTGYETCPDLMINATHKQHNELVAVESISGVLIRFLIGTGDSRHLSMIHVSDK